MLENVSGVCHIFDCDEKLQNNIQNKAKKKKDNHRKMPQSKKVLRSKNSRTLEIVAYDILQNYGSIKQIPSKC